MKTVCVCICVVVCRRFDRLLRDVTICLVGKYTRLQDSYASVIKALSHAAMACNYKLDLKVSVSHTCVWYLYFNNSL